MRSEFEGRHFALHHDKVDVFFKSQWQRSDSSLLYLLYRWVCALAWATILISSLVLYFDARYFIFFTNWGVIMCTLVQIYAALLVTRWHFSPQSRPDEMTIAVKIYWIFYFLIMSMALVITTEYWTLIYGNGQPVDNATINLIIHCFNSVLMMVDFFIVAFPIHLLHTCYVLLLPTTYFSFSYIYYLCGGTDGNGNRFIYPITDWSKPGVVWTTIPLTFVLYIVLDVSLFCLYKLRHWIHHKIFRHDNDL